MPGTLLLRDCELRGAEALRGCSCEVTGSGWVNTLLRATWHAALEPALSAQAAENLQEALDKARAPKRGATRLRSYPRGVASGFHGT